MGDPAKPKLPEGSGAVPMSLDLNRSHHHPQRCASLKVINCAFDSDNDQIDVTGTTVPREEHSAIDTALEVACSSLWPASKPSKDKIRTTCSRAPEQRQWHSGRDLIAIMNVNAGYKRPSESQSTNPAPAKRQGVLSTADAQQPGAFGKALHAGVQANPELSCSNRVRDYLKRLRLPLPLGAAPPPPPHAEESSNKKAKKAKVQRRRRLHPPSDDSDDAREVHRRRKEEATLPLPFDRGPLQPDFQHKSIFPQNVQLPMHRGTRTAGPAF